MNALSHINNNTMLNIFSKFFHPFSSILTCSKVLNIKTRNLYECISTTMGRKNKYQSMFEKNYSRRRRALLDELHFIDLGQFICKLDQRVSNEKLLNMLTTKFRYFRVGDFFICFHKFHMISDVPIAVCNSKNK